MSPEECSIKHNELQLLNIYEDAADAEARKYVKMLSVILRRFPASGRRSHDVCFIRAGDGFSVVLIKVIQVRSRQVIYNKPAFHRVNNNIFIKVDLFSCHIKCYSVGSSVMRSGCLLVSQKLRGSPYMVV